MAGHVKRLHAYLLVVVLLLGWVHESHQAGPFAVAIAAAKLVVIVLGNCLFSEPCKCRQYYLLLRAKQETTNKPGPRFVFGSNGFSWGGQCQLGNTPIAPGATGGVMVGNNGGTVAVGVNGFVSYEIYSDDGSAYLQCNAIFDFVNPYWDGVTSEVKATLRLDGPGCTKPPIVGKADFQNNYNLKLSMIAEEKGAAAKILYEAFYNDASGNSKTSNTNNVLSISQQPICTNSSTNIYYDIPEGQLNSLAFVNGHSYISAEEAGQASNPTYEEDACSVASTKITKGCVTATTYYAINTTKVQYEAQASYTCAKNGAVMSDMTVTSFVYNLYG